MIPLAVIVVSLFGTVLVSLRFTERMVKREDALDSSPTRASIVEKRRILERDRAEWRRSDGAERQMAAIDRQLMALADEEARIALDEVE